MTWSTFVIAIGVLLIAMSGGMFIRLMRLEQTMTMMSKQKSDDEQQYRLLQQQTILQVRQDLLQQLQHMQHIQGQALGQNFEHFNQQSHRTFELIERRLNELKGTVDQRLTALQADNSAKLEAMRLTVDEKLSATLDQRLGASFRLVSERLEAVHQGLGEMQQLATGVGDLKRVLTNVKTRGTWGEVQLSAILEHILTADQYAKNTKVHPMRNEFVEFAIRLPDPQGENEILLPIDAKFPKEEYERLLTAQEAGDTALIEQAALVFEKGIEREAKRIAEKYIVPPYSTDFAVLFLPTEGLYAEALRRPGLLDRLQTLRVSMAGPSTLGAMLNALQMGFKSLAIQQRSTEVWQVLAGVKSEFIKFGNTLEQVKRSLDAASNKISDTETRTRVMLRQLKSVETVESNSENFME